MDYILDRDGQVHIEALNALDALYARANHLRFLVGAAAYVLQAASSDLQEQGGIQTDVQRYRKIAGELLAQIDPPETDGDK